MGRSPDPHICTGCSEPFVVPLSLLEVADRSFVVELACSNCGWAGVGVHDERALEELDRALDRTTAAMAAAADALSSGRML